MTTGDTTGSRGGVGYDFSSSSLIATPGVCDVSGFLTNRPAPSSRIFRFGESADEDGLLAGLNLQQPPIRLQAVYSGRHDHIEKGQIRMNPMGTIAAAGFLLDGIIGMLQRT